MPPEKPKPKTVTIHIDQEIFKVPGPTISAADLRALPEPDIGQDRDVYLEVPGPREDDLITDGEVVTLRNGMHFFTAPSTINPGHAA